jgi:hypothetical protein
MNTIKLVITREEAMQFPFKDIVYNKIAKIYSEQKFWFTIIKAEEILSRQGTYIECIVDFPKQHEWRF